MSDAVGNLIVRSHYANGIRTVEIVQTDDRIAIAPQFLLEFGHIDWPLITFECQLTYRLIEFDHARCAFIAEKQS